MVLRALMMGKGRAKFLQFLYLAGWLVFFSTHFFPLLTEVFRLASGACSMATIGTAQPAAFFTCYFYLWLGRSTSTHCIGSSGGRGCLSL